MPVALGEPLAPMVSEEPMVLPVDPMLPLGELGLREELVVPLVAPEPIVLPVVPWLLVLPLPEDMLLPADELPVPV
jgi:hypothetical protein